jgi:carbon monoxide dehydrogenase subunit G
MQLTRCTSLILLAFALFSCNGRHIKGSGNVSSSTGKTYGDFKKLTVKGSMDVYLTQGPVQAAVIEAEDNILPYIELVKEGDELIVRMKRNISISTNEDIKVTLVAPHVTSLNLTSSGNIKLVNTLSNEESVTINVTGSGDIMGDVHSPEVNSNVTGSGNVTVTGETKDLNINIAGSGDFNGKKLMAENADVNIAGSGNADVHASVRLEAKIIGSGDVNYMGNPSLSTKVMGSGSVHKKD